MPLRQPGPSAAAIAAGILVALCFGCPADAVTTHTDSNNVSSSASASGSAQQGSYTSGYLTGVDYSDSDENLSGTVWGEITFELDGFGTMELGYGTATGQIGATSNGEMTSALYILGSEVMSYDEPNNDYLMEECIDESLSSVNDSVEDFQESSQTYKITLSIDLDICDVDLTIGPQGCAGFDVDDTPADNGANDSQKLKGQVTANAGLETALSISEYGIFGIGVSNSVNMIDANVTTDLNMQASTSTWDLNYSYSSTATVSALSGSLSVFAEDFAQTYSVQVCSWSGDTLVNNATVLTNDAPTASSVSVSIVGQQVAEGTYTYADASSLSESGSTYVWYLSSDSAGDNASTVSTSTTYGLSSSVSNKYVRFCVTPSNGTNFGPQSCSTWTAIGTAETCGGLSSGQSLSSGASSWACSGGYVLAMQGDGNLVEYKGTSVGSNALWASNTDGNSGATVSMQGDGNLVIYTTAGKAIWASNTSGNSGATLSVQGSDGNVVIYLNGKALWATGT